MKKSIIFIFSIFANTYFLFSQSQTKESFRFLNNIITFCNDGTFLETRLGADILTLKNIGDDTISYGKYLYYNNSYILYTSPQWRYSTIELGKVDEVDNTDSSILSIHLLSPFQNMKARHNSFRRYFFYMFTISIIDNEKKAHDTLCGPYFEDIVHIGIENGFSVARIDIHIYPYSTNFITPHIPYLKTAYIPSNPKAKTFILELPQFSAMYPFWRRYYGYIVPKVSRKAIFKDGEYWIRTDVHRFRTALKKNKLSSPYSEDTEY